MRLQCLGLLIALAATTPAGATVYSFTTLTVPDEVPSYFGTQAAGINALGQVVGTYTSSSSLQGFVFNQANGTFTTFNDPASATGTVAQAINDSGQIVGYIPFTAANRIFLRDPTSGAFTIFMSQANQSNPTATAIDNAGQILGYYTNDNLRLPNVTSFVLNPVTGTYTYLPDPNSGNPSSPNFTLANGINSAGQVVGYFENTSRAYNGFLFNLATNTYTTLIYPGSTDTYVQGINNSGQIVGYYDDTMGTEGFVLDLTTGLYTTLTAPNSLATFAEGINDSGKIVGYFTDSVGIQEAFLATPSDTVPIPEPTTIALLGIGVLGLCVARHWRTKTG